MRLPTTIFVAAKRFLKSDAATEKIWNSYSIASMLSESIPARISYVYAKGLNVRAGDAREIPYGDATFDAVLCIAMFHHVAEEDRCRAFRDILRVLRIGGVGILTCWSVEQPEYSKFIFSEGLDRRSL